MKRGANPKAVRLWYRLNQATRIQVKTSAGLTKEAPVGPVIGQGTIGGALISQAVLDDAVTSHFPPAGRLQLEYGAVPQAPLLWMDDILNAAPGLDEARQASRKMDVLMKQRGLTWNEEKTVCLVVGSRKQKEIISKELVENPIMCGNFQMKEKQVEKWLGQIISSRGLEDSVAQTVESREPKIRGAGLEAAALVNDWRSQVAGGMDTAALLWEACCVPSLLHGAGTWMEMSKKTEKQLNSLQYWFLRLILQVGPGTPNAALLWDSGCLDMGLRVWMEKIWLVLHLRQLDDESLAKQVYNEQIANKWPGLAEEVDKICEELEIENANSCRLDFKTYRKQVKEACHKKNEERIKKSIETSKKCERITKEVYGRKIYFKEKNIKHVRELFKARFGLTDFAGNFPNNKKFKKSDWRCICGNDKESEDHIINGECEKYKEIREKYNDLENDEELLEYFKEVLEKREKLEEDEARAGPAPRTRACLLAGGEPTPPVLLAPATTGASRLGDRNVQLVDHL